VYGVVPKIGTDVHHTKVVIVVRLGVGTASELEKASLGIHSMMELFVNQKLEDIVVLIQHLNNTLGTILILEALLVAVKTVFK